MPVCKMLIPKGMTSAEERKNVVKRLTDTLLEAEGLKLNAFARSVCSIQINHPAELYLGGEPVEEECAHFGSNRADSIWTIIFPFAKDNFAVGGRPVSLAETRAFINRE